LQKFLSRLFDRLMKSWSWVLLIICTIVIKWVSLYPNWIEKNYTYGVYPIISKIQRFLFGWIPFSIGDLFYGFLILIILFRTFRFFKLLFQKKLTRKYFASGMQQAIFFFLFIYVFFNLLWGLNYNRRGVAGQLGLDVKTYSKADLDTLCRSLQVKLNYYAAKVDTTYRDQYLNNKKNLFREADATFDLAEKKYSFLSYHPRSIKTSLVGFLGNYIGFLGYYNPFSGEGQIKASIPLFVQPFVSCHEIAHQLGYAKENEANFAGYLACKESASIDFSYSVYYDMYQYAISDMYRADFKNALSIDSSLHSIAKRDRREYARYLYRIENRVAPLMLKMYDSYLKMNNQPKGQRSYNEVVTWLVAYYKKFGTDAL
jgi:Protein of unknown function (DUF3810)